jgi:hypothetical protein
MKVAPIITASVIILFGSAGFVLADNAAFVTVNGTHFENDGDPGSGPA